MSRKKNVMIVAGEASGDIYGANLVLAMKELSPDIAFSGIGGPGMERAGVNILYHASDMAVVGITEIMPKIGYILHALSRLKSILKNTPPDLLIIIDYPGFNLNLAKKARSLGIPVLYYIPPQVWAWRKRRVIKISKRTDRIAVILPFEKDFYREYIDNVDYVGHPLLDISLPEKSNEEIRESLGIDHKREPIIGLLPGSRTEEIARHLPIMIEAAEIISRDFPDLYCILPLASTMKEPFVLPYLKNTAVDIAIGKSDTKELLKISDLALIASGTATLEAAVMETPMIITYKTSLMTYLLARMLVKVSHIGLVNLVAGKTIVPELIQGEATAVGLSEEALAILRNQELKADMKKELQLVKSSLGHGGASQRTAAIAWEMMGR